jgi:anthranilate synthase component 1
MRERVLESFLPEWIKPADVFARLFADRDRLVWLDSGIHASRGMSYIGLSSREATASVHDHTVRVDGVARSGTILDFLRDEPIFPVDASIGFRLGWVGWLGYELRAQTMGTVAEQVSRYPDAALLFIDRAVVFDHESRAMSVIALTESGLAELGDRMGCLLEASGTAGTDAPPEPVGSARFPTVPPPSAPSPSEGAAAWAYGDDEYLRMIADCQEAIRAGDAYQLCLTTEVRVGGTPDPLSTYLALRASSPTRHGVFFRFGEFSLLGASPELFLSVSPDGLIESKPIKGTRRRGVSRDEDEALVAELLGSEKERAENLMIVDLMRNDIGRVSAVGSVGVPSLLAVETYAHVHQLVSTVRGRLAAGLSSIDAVVACFPAGSMTGAPKRRATQILDRLENRARGVYAGAFGYFGLDGRVELSMVIRSILLDRAGATVGTGGGITALSVPLEELDEVKLKAAALLAVLGVA